MFDVEKIKINGAFYEMYENVFGDDFFVILASLRQNARITRLRKKEEKDLSDEEKEELLEANLKVATVMKKCTPRIAYIGSKLYKNQYNGSYQDFLAFLATCDASDFLNPEIISAVWEKIHLDQNVPKSVKNA